ncbi:MAG: hypothetical protein H7123_00405 [Thermoleophilia bacterium]|nr:hypothetical protein [Thermoleophilia bacterium]
MSYSFRHEGAQLPVTLFQDEVEISRPCPLCGRAELEGEVKFKADRERMEGATTARCERGHMVMVKWTRTDEDVSNA